MPIGHIMRLHYLGRDGEREVEMKLAQSAGLGSQLTNSP